jgi:proteasome lid subunit RPN8/RPN11
MNIAIKREVLESCLMGGRESHPREFLGLLSGFRKGYSVTVEQLYLAPLSKSDQRSASYDSYNVPVGLGVVGTFHSHPSGPALPSAADLRLFSRAGAANLIAAYPYAIENVRAFDSSGKEISFVIV